MHRLLCERPNVVPPAVITGVGPQGASTVYYQAQSSTTSTRTPTPPSPVSDTHIDPQLRDLDVNVATRPQSPPVTAETVAVSVTSGSSQVAGATPSGKEKLSLAMQKVSASIKPLSNKKRTFEEQMVEMTEYVVMFCYILCRSSNIAFVIRKSLAMAGKRLAEERREKRQKLSLQKRELLLNEFREGLITREEYRTSAGIDKSSSSTTALDTALFSSSPLFISDFPSAGVGGSDDIVGGGWER